MKSVQEIRNHLFELQDLKYKELQAKIIPNIDADSIIGVRTPELRSFAKELVKAGDVFDFLSDLPHKYFDENQLHAFILSEIKDYHNCVELVYAFLPFVDNWATCDQLTPKAFKKHKDELLKSIDTWISSKDTYAIRFAMKMLMTHFLDEDFDVKYPKMVASVKSEEYYINMMIAWYFATALAKQYEAILPFIENQCLEPWTHNKAIQKSVESYRISNEQKTYLKSLKVKK